MSLTLWAFVTAFVAASFVLVGAGLYRRNRQQQQHYAGIQPPAQAAPAANAPPAAAAHAAAPAGRWHTRTYAWITGNTQATASLALVAILAAVFYALFPTLSLAILAAFPSWALPLLVIAIAIIVLSPLEGTAKVLAIAIGTVVVVGLIANSVPTGWWTARPAAHVRALQPAASACRGSYDTITVGQNWVAVNPNFDCYIILEVVGAPMYLGEPHNNVLVSPGEDLGNVLKSKGVRIIYAKAKYGAGRLNYRLVKHGCKQTGWECK